MTEHALRLGTMVAMLGLVGMLLPLGVRTLQRNFLLQRSIMLQVAAPCNYGEQAYRFSPLPEPDKQGQQWTFDAMDQRCSLQPLVSSLLARSRARDPYTGRQLRILFNGDSIDRKMIEEYCLQARTRVTTIPSNGSDGRWTRATLCDTSTVMMLQVWITGVHDDPPREPVEASADWHKALADASVKGLRGALGAASPEASLLEGARMFRELTNSSAPDVIVLSSALWDVTNWLITEQLPRDNAPLFLGDLGLQYEAGLRTQIARIARLFPTLPVLAMHTSVPFSYSRHLQAPNRMGKNYHPYEAAYISQINTIQRHVARDLGIPLIDYEVIMDQIPVEEAFEQDGRHIRPQILVRTMLEVMVNLYAASPSGSDFPLAAD